MNLYAITSEKVAIVNKSFGISQRQITRIIPFFVGVVSPYNNPMIMYTRLPSETILHTDYDIQMVTKILNQKGIKHKVQLVEKSYANFRTISK